MVVVKEPEVVMGTRAAEAFVRVNSPTDWVRVGGKHLDAAFANVMFVEEPVAVELKARGNEWFKEGRYAEAYLAYSREIATMNLKRLEETQTPPEIETSQDVLGAVILIPEDLDPAMHTKALEDPECADLIYGLLVNRAAVAERLSLLRRALVDVDAALVVRLGDARARLRRAHVLTKLQQYEEALGLWKELRDEFKGDSEVAKMVEKVRRRLQEVKGVF
mmetsp:Transcript_14964/g.40162  ORF Transcript_14964/g.40162 Transcript_14964/m.40162 type:complete len:220 (+) Transcript_14964:2-661(+)